MIKIEVQTTVRSNLAGSFVGAHLQTDGGLVIRLISVGLWVIQMSSGSICCHSSLTGTLVCSHLRIKQKDGLSNSHHLIL